MRPSTLTGSCLCGAVHYEVTGEATKFYHCHCKRCRKATGTGHASNLMVPGGSLTWLKGEELTRFFKVPEAQRFATRFCTVCGSLLPRFVQQTNSVVIPGGSLDCEPPLSPQARIFWDSRASWSCTGDDLPVHLEYPG